MTAHDVCFVVGGVQDMFPAPCCECTALTVTNTMENIITKFYPSWFLFSFFLQRVVDRKHYHQVDNGAVKHGLEPKG